MRSIIVLITFVLAGCQIALQGQGGSEDAAERRSDDVTERGVVAGSSSSGRAITAIDIDGPATLAASDGLVFGSTWVGPCAGLGLQRLRQSLVGYANGIFQAFHYSFDAYRVSGVAFAVKSGDEFDLARRCTSPETYPEAGFFSFGTKTAKSPVDVPYYRNVKADEDGIVTASVWLGSNVYQQVVTGYTGSTSTLNSSVAVAWNAIERQGGDGGMVSASITFPVKKGTYYSVRAKNMGSGTYPLAKFTAVPGLGVGAYELKSDPRGTYTASSDGFVLASAWTGKCKRNSVASFQQVDGYMSDDAGQMKRMAVRADYGDYRAVSILYPVLAGRTYKVGFFCIDSLTYATTLFIPLGSPDVGK